MRVEPVGGKLTSLTFDLAIALDGYPGLTVDLQHLNWIEPHALVGLACLIEEFRAAGETVTFLPPSSVSVQNYLSRSGLGALLASTGCGNPLPTVYHYNSPTVLELQPVLPGEGVDRLAEMVLAKVGAAFGGAGVVDQLYWSLLELGYNVEEHAGSTGWFAAQVIPAYREIMFTVGDWGLGISETLREGGHDFADDKSAITAAVQSRVSSKPKNGGAGLPSIADAVKQLAGSLVVRSGEARVTFNAAGVSVSAPVSTPIGGTLVSVKMRCA